MGAAGPGPAEEFASSGTISRRAGVTGLARRWRSLEGCRPTTLNVASDTEAIHHGWCDRMICPFCEHPDHRVVESRVPDTKDAIRRRRECLGCGRRFTSYERIDEIPYMVIKKDGSRERFERQKLLAGLLKACEKRPVSVASLEAVADRVESALQDKPEREMSTEEVGAFVMNELRHLDKVAYVRFASVYRHFRDIGEFMTELKDLLNAKE